MGRRQRKVEEGRGRQRKAGERWRKCEEGPWWSYGRRSQSRLWESLGDGAPFTAYLHCNGCGPLFFLFVRDGFGGILTRILKQAGVPGPEDRLRDKPGLNKFKNWQTEMQDIIPCDEHLATSKIDVALMATSLASRRKSCRDTRFARSKHPAIQSIHVSSTY